MTDEGLIGFDEDAPLDPLDLQEIGAAIDEAAYIGPSGAQEIDAAIEEASCMPIPGLDDGEQEAVMPTGLDGEEPGRDSASDESTTPSSGRNYSLSEEEAAEILVDVLSRSAVSVEGGRIRAEPDPAEVAQWNEEKRQDVQDVLGQVSAQPRNVRLIAEALEIENARLEELMAEHEEALAQAGYDDEAPEVVALAQQIQELHAKIQDLSEQYRSLPGAGMPVPHMRGPRPFM